MVNVSDCCRYLLDDGICRNCKKSAIAITKDGDTCNACGSYHENKLLITDCIYDKYVNPSTENLKCNCCDDCRNVCRNGLPGKTNLFDINEN
jgi:hypothetical protein